MGDLLRAGVHVEGVHAERHRDQERVAARGRASLLQGQRTGRLVQQENAQRPRKGQRRTYRKRLGWKMIFLFCIFLQYQMFVLLLILILNH